MTVTKGQEIKVHFPIINKAEGTARMVPSTVKYLGTKLTVDGTDFYDFQNIKNQNVYCFSITELQMLSGHTHEECNEFEF